MQIRICLAKGAELPIYLVALRTARPCAGWPGRSRLKNIVFARSARTFALPRNGAARGACGHFQADGHFRLRCRTVASGAPPPRAAGALNGKGKPEGQSATREPGRRKVHQKLRALRASCRELRSPERGPGMRPPKEARWRRQKGLQNARSARTLLASLRSPPPAGNAPRRKRRGAPASPRRPCRKGKAPQSARSARFWFPCTQQKAPGKHTLPGRPPGRPPGRWPGRGRRDGLQKRAQCARFAPLPKAFPRTEAPGTPGEASGTWERATPEPAVPERCAECAFCFASRRPPPKKRRPEGSQGATNAVAAQQKGSHKCMLALGRYIPKGARLTQRNPFPRAPAAPGTQQLQMVGTPKRIYGTPTRGLW